MPLSRKPVTAGAALLLLGALTAVAAPPAAADGGVYQSLVTWYHWGREDNFTAATDTQHSLADAAGYEVIRYEEAWLLALSTNNTGVQQPLALFYNSARGDYMSTAHRDGIASAYSAGYKFQGNQGYVWTTRQPGTVPLYQYWNPDRQDNFAAASSQGIAAAESAGYVRVRVEGYVYPDTAF